MTFKRQLLSVLFTTLTMLSAHADEHGEHLPLPETAQGPAIDPAVGYVTERLTGEVYMVTDGLYQALFVDTADGVVVVDAPPTLGDKLLKAIAETTKTPITHLIYSHSHIDHIGAAHLFGDDIVRIASDETANKLARFSDPNRPAPTVTFPKQYDLTVGGVRFELDAAGAGHEPGNLFIYLPNEKVLMAVDIVFPGWVPFTNLGMAEDVGLYVENHDALLAYDFDVFVGGHIGRAGNRADVEIAQQYLKDLVTFANEGRATVNFYDIAKSTGWENKWLLVKTYMDAVADHCAEKMIAKWGSQLGGADVSTPGHCWIMQEFLNINGEPGHPQPVAQSQTIRSSNSGPLTVINVLTPKPEDQKEVVARLTQGIANEIRLLDGFIAASVHQSLNSERVIVYAQWRDGDALAAAGAHVQSGNAPNMARAYQLGNPDYNPFAVVSVVTALPFKP